MFLQELKLTWNDAIELEFDVIQTENNPQSSWDIPQDETVVVLYFEVDLTDESAQITLCIPYNSFKRIFSIENASSETFDTKTA